MLKDAQIPHAFKSIFLISYALVKRTSVIIACHQHVFNVAVQESKRAQELHMRSTTYSKFLIRLLVPVCSKHGNLYLLATCPG